MADLHKMARGFDFMASFYDASVSLFFGKRLLRLQTDLVDQFSSLSNCLIIGGGSGEILHYCFDKNLATNYFYAEISQSMIDKAKSRIEPSKRDQVVFTQNFESIDNQIKFDLILLPFVLDFYEPKEVKTMLSDLKSRISSTGKIGIVDFYEGSSNHIYTNALKRIFIRVLYLFFRFSAGVRPTKIPPFFQILEEIEMRCDWKILKYNAWLQASIWSKMYEEE